MSEEREVKHLCQDGAEEEKRTTANQMDAIAPTRSQAVVSIGRDDVTPLRPIDAAEQYVRSKPPPTKSLLLLPPLRPIDTFFLLLYSINLLATMHPLYSFFRLTCYCADFSFLSRVLSIRSALDPPIKLTP